MTMLESIQHHLRSVAEVSYKLVLSGETRRELIKSELSECQASVQEITTRLGLYIDPICSQSEMAIFSKDASSEPLDTQMAQLRQTEGIMQCIEFLIEARQLALMRKISGDTVQVDYIPEQHSPFNHLLDSRRVMRHKEHSNQSETVRTLNLGTIQQLDAFNSGIESIQHFRNIFPP
ncbi:hypothetical protein BGZ63DRAFT_191287 [Mariannaea sp. PMI_226]|nr:hypothetical protein BGZ63DRAFT_191287 [Mariannaea sp. PMI_226]